MIQVTVTERKGKAESIVITGHAGYAEHGKDLICAAVSGIAFGLCNAMDQLADSSRVSITENRIEIGACGPEETAETILRTGIIQLETIAEHNSRFIKVKKLEV